MKLSNWKLAPRLGMGFGLLVLLLVILPGVAMTQINGSNHAITEMLDDRYAKVMLAQSIETGVNEQARYLRDAIIGADDKTQMPSRLGKIAEATRRNDVCMAKLESMINASKGNALFEVLRQARGRYGLARTATIQLLHGRRGGRKSRHNDGRNQHHVEQDRRYSRRH